MWFLLPSHHDNGAFVCVYNSTISSHLAVLSSLMASWLVALCYDFDALVVCCRCFFCLCCCEDWLQHVSVVHQLLDCPSSPRTLLYTVACFKANQNKDIIADKCFMSRGKCKSIKFWPEGWRSKKYLASRFSRIVSDCFQQKGWLKLNV